MIDSTGPGRHRTRTGWAPADHHALFRAILLAMPEGGLGLNRSQRDAVCSGSRSVYNGNTINDGTEQHFFIATLAAAPPEPRQARGIPVGLT
jgi:hypothetical protein